MSSHFTVVYDACVLYPAPLRDLLMRLALTDRFRARWSDAIHDEWIRNLRKQRPELDPPQCQHSCRILLKAIFNYEHHRSAATDVPAQPRVPGCFRGSVRTREQ